MKGFNCKTAISHGAEVDVQNHARITALMIASRSGNHEITRQLLLNGAKPNRQNFHGDSALTLASEKDHSEVMKLVKIFGAREPIFGVGGWKLALSQKNRRRS